MTEKQTLALIADIYTPLLAAVSFAYILMALWNTQWRLAFARFLAVAGGLAVAYALMFFDQRLNIWSEFSLDYSTHTAVALALVAFLSVTQPALAALWCGSLAGYALLMVYLDYHTFADILTTGAVVIIAAGLVLASLYKHWPYTASVRG